MKYLYTSVYNDVNYINEILLKDGPVLHNHAHDHLYSPAALMDDSADILERYEYDAYGNVHVMDSSYNFRSGPSYNNTTYFTGRRTDTLDNGDLEVYYYRHRYYDDYTGRFMMQDPLGMNPAGGRFNAFNITSQYNDGLNLYEYVEGLPTIKKDSYGLIACKSYYFTVVEVGKIKEDEPAPGDPDNEFEGLTTPGKWRFNIYPAGSEDCKGSCKKVICENNSWGAMYWYRTSKAKHHEERHVEIFQWAHRHLEDKVRSSVPFGCMGEKKAKCYASAMRKFKAAYRKGAQAKHSGLDCLDYYPGPSKEEACEDRDREWEEYLELVQEAALKLRSCRRIKKCTVH